MRKKSIRFNFIHTTKNIKCHEFSDNVNRNSPPKKMVRSDLGSIDIEMETNRANSDGMQQKRIENSRKSAQKGQRI